VLNAPVISYISRPPPGTKGKKLVLWANFFKVANFVQGNVYHYDVVCKPEVKSAPVLKRMITTSETDAKSPLFRLNPVFDGRRNMYTVRPIPGTANGNKVQLRVLDDEGAVKGPKKKGGEGANYVTVEIQQAGDPVNMFRLAEFIANRTNELPRDAMQVVDIALRHLIQITRFPMGRAIFTPDDQQMRVALGGGLDCWLGHTQTARVTQMGLMLNVDCTAVAVLSAGPALSFIMNSCNMRDAREVTVQRRFQIAKCMRGVQIQVTHRGQHKRKYRVVSVSEGGANREVFDTPEGQTTVAAYFAKTYSPLRYPDMPCLRVGTKGILLPIEVCAIVPGQRTRNLTGDQTTKMLNATCQDPLQRYEDICAGVPDSSRDPYMKEFKLSVSPDMARVNGRILSAPTLQFSSERNVGQVATVEPRNGTWSLKDVAFRHAQSITSSVVLMVGTEHEVPTRNTQQWFGNFMKTCGTKGVKFNAQPIFRRVEASPGVLENTMKAVCASRPSMVFCFLADRKDPMYPVVKRVSETMIGVPTQCFDMAKIMNFKTSGVAYQANVALKVNAKLGGVNQVVHPNIPIISSMPTMVMGADVHHPSPGDKGKPSIAAVVGSYDMSASKYHSIVQQQAHRLEPIAHMAEATTTLLKNFYAKTRSKPAQIIMYRDGVGEAAFPYILNHELRAMRLACASLESGYNPRITFIIVQKRNHIRLFPDDEKDKFVADRNHNMLPGTVVDTGVVHPQDFDFLMCSHAGLKGTSKATHYHVVADDSKFSSDQLQEMTFNLCHVYARCTRSVSIPAPAFYAHLAAFRARLWRADYDTDDTVSVASRGSQGEAPSSLYVLPTLKPELFDRLFFA